MSFYQITILIVHPHYTVIQTVIDLFSKDLINLYP